MFLFQIFGFARVLDSPSQMHVCEHEESFYTLPIPLILYVELLLEHTPTTAISTDFWWSTVAKATARIV